jgi:DNA-binding XRE family transcriptional regulator
MTTLAIRSDSESPAESRKSSPALRTLVVYGTDGTSRLLKRPLAANAANSERCPVYFVDASQSAETRRKSFSDFEDLVESLEKDGTSAAELKEARRWVATSFYDANRPTLATLRLLAGLSQRQLGEACGMEQPHVSRYESGKHEPSLTTSVCMARALGVGLDAFVGAWESTRAMMQSGAVK